MTARSSWNQRNTVIDRAYAQFRNRFRSLSNVNRSDSQNASKNAAAAAEKTEQSNGVLMPRPVTMPIANDKR